MSMIWVSADRRQNKIKTMELSHLQNLLVYLNRHNKGYEEIRIEAEKVGKFLPDMVIQEHPIQKWIKAIVNELNARDKKACKEAERILKTARRNKKQETSE